MRDYRYFDDEKLKVSSMSYRSFTQAYADPVTYTNKLNIHYSSSFYSMIYHSYPVSLRYILDNIPLVAQSDYVVLLESNLATIKSIPKTMEHPSLVTAGKRHMKDSLVASFDECLICSTHGNTSVESSSRGTHNFYVSMMSVVAGSTGRHTDVVSSHCFSFPSREMNYRQLLLWCANNGVRHSTSSIRESITIYDFIDSSSCEAYNRVLESNRCYDNGDYEVYRLKGEKVLELSVHSSRDRSIIEQRILGMFSQLDATIQECFVDPMDLDCSDIARLRATNSIAFDGMYCRKAPPRVQPIVIRLEQVEGVLKSGRMILIYEDRYYTTKDKSVSGGEDYIGMVNRFGDYDPRKRYNALIRTYKKNHLLSKSFKELKAYVLRNSQDPTRGSISREDILLPKHMEYLYEMQIHNPILEVSGIHTKKMVLTNTNKVLTGEVPDYVRSLLNTSKVRRYVSEHSGSGLLQVCGVDSAHFLNYALENKLKHKDTMFLTDAVVADNIMSSNVDHRLYGKLLEEYTGVSLIVFDIEGLVPYRCSKLEKNRSMLLLLSSDGTYDMVRAIPEEGDTIPIANIKSIINSSTCMYECMSFPTSGRHEDYTLTHIKLVCYIARLASSCGIHVSYKVVPESDCKSIVELVYCSCIYYECMIKNSECRFVDSLVESRKSDSKVVKSSAWITALFKSMIHSVEDNRVTILAPVDMSSYYKWNLNLEDCLYYSPGCYRTSAREEVQLVVVSESTQW